MTERLIHPEDYPYRHPPLLEFIRTNGLDPWAIPEAFPIVTEGGQLTVTEFVFEELPDGRRRKVLIHNPDGTVESFAKHSVTVPLKSPPEDHGL